MRLENQSLAEPNQRPDIDGLRALAIVPVVLYHAGLSCPGGFVGVDVFFVISGFLIGGIILRELEAGTFTFARFWERRVRRIVPVLLVFAAVTFFAGWRLLFPEDFNSLASQTIAALCAVGNFKFRPITGGYWAPTAQSLPLLHTWSLAVEEQFYLVMPLMLVATRRWFRRQTGLVLTLLAGVSLLWCLASHHSHPKANFFLLPSRAWELLTGCLGAWGLHRGLALPRTILRWSGAAGVILILASAFALREDRFWPNAWTLLPTVGTALVLVSAAPPGGTTPAAWFLSLPPLRFIGLISYSLYLWHWPMIVFLKEYQPDRISVAARCLVVAASVALAAASWRFVEQPFRNKLKSFRVGTKPLLIGVAAAWICLLAVSALAIRKSGRIEQSFQAGMRANYSTEAVRLIFDRRGRREEKGFDATSQWRDGGLRIGAGHEPPRCVILGSSHSTVLGPVLESLSQTYQIPCAMLTQIGTPAFFAGTNRWVAAYHSDNLTKQWLDAFVKRDVVQWKPEVVIIAGRWTLEMPLEWGRTSEPSTAAFQEAYTNTLNWLLKHSKKIVILGQVPELPLGDSGDNKKDIWRRYKANGDVMPVFQEHPATTALRHDALAILSQAASTNVFVLDPDPIFHNPDGSIRYYSGKGVFYYDDNHVNPLGATELKPLLEPFFKEMARGSVSK